MKSMKCRKCRKAENLEKAGEGKKDQAMCDKKISKEKVLLSKAY